MTPSDQPINPILRLMREAQDAWGKAPKEYVCENGVKLALKKVPRQLVVESVRRVPVPKPPVIFDEEKQRNITNELDPDYLDEVQAYNTRTGQMTTAMYFGLGTSVVMPLPAGVPGPDDDEWVDAIHEFDQALEIPDKKTKARYIAWLTLFCMSNEDSAILSGILFGFYGSTREEAVADAMATFPGDMAGRSDNGSGSTDASANTNPNSSDVGVRP